MRPRSNAAALAGLILLILIGGPLLLYAYRSQTPAVQSIPMSQVIQEIHDGAVRSMTIENDRATITLADGRRQETGVPAGPTQPLLAAVTDYNSAHLSSPISIEVRNGPQQEFFPVLISIFLSLLPILLLGALAVFAARLLSGGRTADRYERLARAADLRDRGVLTEEEFQIEKRKIMR